MGRWQRNYEGGYRGGYDRGDRRDRSGSKHSGAYSREVDGRLVMWGWRIDRASGGLMKFVATPSRKHTGTHTSRSGKVYRLFVAKIQVPDRPPFLTNMLVREDGAGFKGYMPDLNLMASTGGCFFGRVSRRGR